MSDQTVEGNAPVQGNPANTPVGLPEDIAKLIPSKFGGDIGKFVKSYGELEKTLSTRNKAPEAPVDSKVTKEAVATKTFADVENRFWASKGQLAVEDRQALIEAGFSERMIQGMANTYTSELTALKTKIESNLGGVKYDDFEKYINDQVKEGKMTTDEVDFINRAIDLGKFGALTEIASQIKAISSDKGTYKAGEIPGAGDGFNSTAELRKAFADDRVRRQDPDYLKALQDKVERSNPELVAKFQQGL